MNYPSNLKYTKDHEWAKEEDGLIRVGITDYAQHELGDVVYVELPKIGTKTTQGRPFGVVESVKAASDVYSPISGNVIEGNPALADDPAIINNDPEGAGWFFKLEVTDPSELEGLMDENAYRDFVASL